MICDSPITLETRLVHLFEVKNRREVEERTALRPV